MERATIGAQIVLFAVEQISKLVGKPTLRIEKVYIQNFQYLKTYPIHYRRFIIAKIRNVGRKGATGCLGKISIDEKGLTDIKLHWADEPYEIRRDSAIKINLAPNEPRDLDIAFSVCGGQSPKTKKEPVFTTGVGPLVSVNALGGTIYSTKKTTHDRSSTLTRGTYDPYVIPSDSNYLAKSDKEERIDPPLKGAWIASHLAIGNPIYNSRDYLRPGRYHAEIEVICENGSGHRGKLVIISREECIGLLADLRKSPFY